MDTYGYCVRVDALEGYAEKIRMLQICEDYRSIVAVRHKGRGGENPHYHLVIRTQVKSQAFRVRLKKIFDQGKGNGHMSIKPWDGCNDAISYMFHEDDNAELLIQHNVSDETIVEARQRNEQVQREIAKAKERASWKLIDEVYEQFKGKDTPYDVDIAKAIVLTAFRSGKYVPNDFLVKSMVRQIQFRLLEGDVTKEEAYAEYIADKIFSRERT